MNNLKTIIWNSPGRTGMKNLFERIQDADDQIYDALRIDGSDQDMGDPWKITYACFVHTRNIIWDELSR